MNPTRIIFPKEEAHQLWMKYREHRDVATPQDRKIEDIYRRISRGEKVIKAIESIRQAGLDANGDPRLALIRADANICFYRKETNQVVFRMDSWGSDNWHRRRIVVPWQGMGFGSTKKSIVPLIPLHLRPKTSLTNYHILFEAEWQMIPPTDPMLLRRFGNDLWLVVAAWDLTAVERAVLGGA